jgi:hypothetical protein
VPAGFDIIEKLSEPQTMASGREIRELKRLTKTYAKGRWRKRKCVAMIRLGNGKVRQAEIHWYEAHGVGAVEHKIKRFISEP